MKTDIKESISVLRFPADVFNWAEIAAMSDEQKWQYAEDNDIYVSVFNTLDEFQLAVNEDSIDVSQSYIFFVPNKGNAITEEATSEIEKKFKVSYVFGTKAVREYANCVGSGKKWNISRFRECGSVSNVKFATQAELDAYKLGVEDATGWFESERVMTDEEWEKYLEENFSDEDYE